jgi:hypothetical protein
MSFFQSFRQRHTETRPRSDGKLDIVVVFYTGVWSGTDCRILDEITVVEKVGPRQAVTLISRLDDALASAYIQGRHNQEGREHGDRPIPEKVTR